MPDLKRNRARRAITCPDCGVTRHVAANGQVPPDGRRRCYSCAAKGRRYPGRRKGDTNGIQRGPERAALMRDLWRDRYPDQSWTEDRIVGAIRRWARRTGEPPTQSQWSKPLGRGKFMVTGHLASRPAASTVAKVFGSWNAGITAAGLNPRPQYGAGCRKAECKHGHSMSGDNLYISPTGARRCRACRAAADRRRNA